MTLEEVYHFYGNATKAAEAVNVSRQAFHTWIRRGIIPFNQQQRYEKLTSGKLKACKNTEKQPKESKNVIFPQFRYYSEKLGMCDVHSLTYLSNREPRIIYFCPSNRQIKFSSFNVANLMQSTQFVDANKKVLYEGDIVQCGEKKFAFNNIRELQAMLKIKQQEEFLIIGNIFEGSTNGH